MKSWRDFLFLLLLGKGFNGCDPDQEIWRTADLVDLLFC
jgi:hypothetical protein